MKTITLDWDSYKKELRDSEYKGFRQGLAVSRRVALELLAGASRESLNAQDDEFFGDSNDVKNLESDLRPRIERLLKCQAQ